MVTPLEDGIEEGANAVSVYEVNVNDWRQSTLDPEKRMYCCRLEAPQQCPFHSGHPKYTKEVGCKNQKQKEKGE